MAEAQGSRESFRDKREALPVDQTAHVAPESLAREYEVQEVNLRALAIFVVALMIVLGLISLLLWWFVGFWTNDSVRPRVEIEPAQVTPVQGPGPGIEPFPAAERATVVAPAGERLTTYGWVDRENGIVHIPIDQAMQRLVEQNLPAATGEPPAFADEPAYDLDSSGGQGPYGERN
jgi:hypothetical protein